MAGPTQESSLDRTSQSSRVLALDGLRGIAATTVVFHHWGAITHFDLLHWYQIPLFAGHEAVILFFVLSGYVLSLPFWRDRQPPYPQYLVRRIFRIYVPFLVALLFSFLGCVIFYGTHLPLSQFYMLTWQTPPVAGLFARQLLMPTNPSLNGAFWSLRYEMELSIIFPFVCTVVARMRSFLWVVPMIALRVIQILLVHTSFAQSSISTQNIAGTLYYATFFVVGNVLARDRVYLSRLVTLLPRPILWLSFLVGVGCYYSTMFVRLTPGGG